MLHVYEYNLGNLRLIIILFAGFDAIDKCTIVTCILITTSKTFNSILLKQSRRGRLPMPLPIDECRFINVKI